MLNYLYWAFFIGGMVLIYFAIRFYNQSNIILDVGIKTTATVVDLIEVSDDDGPTYKPVFEYLDRTNTKREFKSNVSSRPAAYIIGEKAKIVYDPDDLEEVKTITYWGLYRWTIILLCIAAPLMIIGGGYLLYTRG